VAGVTVGPSAYWYLTRASGAVALILLTVSVVLGIAVTGRLRARGVPRFMIDGLHRTVSLLAVAFLIVHIITAVLDSFASISLTDAVIPFAGSYRPLWLGLGALAFDLLLAVAITSLVRVRLGQAAWRGVHWPAYACWPLAVLHGFGTGSDARQAWMLAIDVGCILAVLVAVAARVAIGWPDNPRLRLGALGAAAAFALGLVIWLPGGPLARGWAKRAGTPRSLLSSGRGRRA
jgi:methionine sulfoxide reductase heme-binding subunit